MTEKPQFKCAICGKPMGNRITIYDGSKCGSKGHIFIEDMSP